MDENRWHLLIVMDEYKIILEEKQTVMARYEVEPKSGEGYQSEAQLENALIKQLADQGYEYAKIKDEAALLDNLRLHQSLVYRMTKKKKLNGLQKESLKYIKSTIVQVDVHLIGLILSESSVSLR